MKKYLSNFLSKKLFTGLMCIILFPLIPWGLIFIMSICEVPPPKPEICYGEFPFKLEYMIGEEKITIEDSVICEYAGIKWNEGIGKHRVWQKRLKSCADENPVMIRNKEYTVLCDVGSAEYYMNDPNRWTPEVISPHIYTVGGEYTQREIIDKHKIKIISWEFSEPIVNRFK